MTSEAAGQPARGIGARLRAAREQRIPGQTESIEYEDAQGKWHVERALGTEYYTLLAGQRGPGSPYERDLFGG